MTFDPKFTDLHSSPKERQLQKKCVSFGEECTILPFTLIVHITAFYEKLDCLYAWDEASYSFI